MGVLGGALGGVQWGWRVLGRSWGAFGGPKRDMGGVWGSLGILEGFGGSLGSL